MRARRLQWRGRSASARGRTSDHTGASRATGRHRDWDTNPRRVTMRSAIAPGGVFPDYELPDQENINHGPMIPHTLVLKPGLVVHKVYNGYWFWGRPSIVDLWHDLRDVTREIRPDWDLDAPGLRAAWEAGDHAPFHGWNKRTEQLAAPAPAPTS